MRNSISVLRATTAIMVSLSFIGAHAGAAELRLAQATVEQPAEQPANQGEQQTTGEQAPAAEVQSDGSIEPAATEAQPAEQGQAAEQAPAAGEVEAGEDAAETQRETQPGAEVEAQTTESGAVTTDEQAGAEAQKSEGSAPAASEAASEVVAPPAEGQSDADAPATEGQGEATTETQPPAAGEAQGEAAAAAPAETQPQGSADTQATEQSAEQAPEQPTESQTQTESQPPAAAEVPPAAAVETQPQAGSGAGATESATGTTQPPAASESQPSGGQASETAVTEQNVKEAAAAGEDVVVKESTTNEELQQQLDELRQQTTDLQSQLQEAQAVNVQDEVVTEATARSATEEVDEDDDSNNVWKYLGAAAGGAVVGALVPVLGGRLVQDQGDRVVVERGGEFFVRKDETQLLRQPGARVQTETFDGGITRQTVTREDGSQVVTVRNQGGFILRRTRITPDGQEIVLLEQTPEELYNYSDWQEQLPPATAHRSGTVDYTGADPDALRRTLEAQPVYQLERSYPLQAVREVERVRELVPAVDLPINFASGSAAIQRSEVEELTALGRMMSKVIVDNPREIFLVEGHTDAVGSNVMNLALSDRRAEAVALALTEYFDIPPENLVVQGYGERFLKEQTEAASATNRRATVRRITPLIDRVAAR